MPTFARPGSARVPEDGLGSILPAVIIGLLLGGLFIALGTHEFRAMARMEADGGSLKMNIFELLLYKIGGKWLACGFFWLLGGVFFGVGLMGVWELLMMALRKSRE